MRRKRSTRHGFALVTALFIVMLVYLITTVVMSQANQDASWTRFGSTRVQAGFLADQNATLAIKQMNLDNTWGPAHTVGPSDPVQSGQSVSWVGNVLVAGVPSPRQVRLFTQANVGGQLVSQNRIVGQKAAVSPVEYALRDLEASNLPAVIYQHQVGGWSGTPLPPIPALYWTGSTGHWARQDPPHATQPGFANKIPYICGDAKGDVYCVWNRSPINQILRYNATSNGWELLPPIVDPSTGGTLASITCIACNDKTDLVAVCAKGSGSYIAHLDVSQPLPPASSDYGSVALTGTWTPVSPIPNVNYASGHYTSASGNYPGPSQSIAIDNLGHIFDVAQTPASTNPTNVFRYTPTPPVPPATAIDWTQPGWQVLAPPTQIIFNWVNNQDVQTPGPTDPPSNNFVPNLIAPCVDGQSGDFFGCWNRNNDNPPTPQIDTIYHFTAGTTSGIELDGRWQANPLPPPKQYCDLQGNQSPGTGIANPSQYVVDQASNLVGAWEPQGLATTVYTHPLVGGSDWTTLEYVPKNFWQLNPSDPNGYSLDSTSGASADVSCLGGGGIPLGTQSFVYVPSATY